VIGTKSLKDIRISPAQIIIIGFILLILAGSLLLMLPFATRDGNGSSFIDALFTATSATCVTGLVIHDTYTYWSEFGQVIILLLIQIGGMGVVTTAVAIFLFTGKHIGLRQRFVLQEALAAPHMGGIIRLIGFILKTAFIIEGIGAVLLSLRFCPQLGLIRGIWNGIFHSVSAFCNAGFDLFGWIAPFSSLTSYAADPLINLTIMALIIIGGIGFLTWHDISEHRWHFHYYTLQSKIIFTTTFLLIVLPCIFFFFYEFSGAQWADLSTGERVLASLFQAVTPRTAGFNTADLSRMSSVSILIIIVLMLIGGSPSSTAGGMKTTTIATLFVCLASVFKKRQTLQVFGRRIPQHILRNVVVIFTLYILLFLSFGTAIACIDGIPLQSALFEAASAIGTVGLSLGVTPYLSTVSHILLIILMYFGRIGGLTLIFAFINHLPAPSQMPQENITVG
jgi:trk system potassium uptake protein TrkH